MLSSDSPSSSEFGDLFHGWQSAKIAAETAEETGGRVVRLVPKEEGVSVTGESPSQGRMVQISPEPSGSANQWAQAQHVAMAEAHEDQLTQLSTEPSLHEESGEVVHPGLAVEEPQVLAAPSPFSEKTPSAEQDSYISVYEAKERSEYFSTLFKRYVELEATEDLIQDSEVNEFESDEDAIREDLLRLKTSLADDQLPDEVVSDIARGVAEMKLGNIRNITGDDEQGDLEKLTNVVQEMITSS